MFFALICRGVGWLWGSSACLSNSMASYHSMRLDEVSRPMFHKDGMERWTANSIYNWKKIEKPTNPYLQSLSWGK